MNRLCCFYGIVPCFELKSKFHARDKPTKERLNSENLYPLEVQIPKLSVLKPGVNGHLQVFMFRNFSRKKACNYG